MKTHEVLAEVLAAAAIGLLWHPHTRGGHIAKGALVGFIGAVLIEKFAERNNNALPNT